MSFTLTMVVVGVILMTTALTIITVGTSSIPKFINTITGAGEDQTREKRIQNQCADVTSKIQNQYCEKWLDRSGSGFSDKDGDPLQRTPPVLKRLRGTDWVNRTCADDALQCPVNYDDGAVTYKSSKSAGAPEIEIDTEITIDGNTYDCVQRGITPTVCPVK